ncbi:MAG: hypothetical protein ACJ73V_12045 [Acidimicrobiia bacterium]
MEGLIDHLKHMPGSSARPQDCGVLFASQHEGDRLPHLIRLHVRAYAERLVEHSQDAHDHGHQHGHAAERGDPTGWARGVVDGEEKDHEKRAHVDDDPQRGGDIRFGEEQQSLPGLACVGDESAGASIGGSLHRIAARKL